MAFCVILGARLLEENRAHLGKLEFRAEHCASSVAYAWWHLRCVWCTSQPPASCFTTYRRGACIVAGTNVPRGTATSTSMYSLRELGVIVPDQVMATWRRWNFPQTPTLGACSARNSLPFAGPKGERATVTAYLMCQTNQAICP